jgi:RHS repeat-associated protein
MMISIRSKYSGWMLVAAVLVLLASPPSTSGQACSPITYRVEIEELFREIQARMKLANKTALFPLGGCCNTRPQFPPDEFYGAAPLNYFWLEDALDTAEGYAITLDETYHEGAGLGQSSLRTPVLDIMERFKRIRNVVLKLKTISGDGDTSDVMIGEDVQSYSGSDENGSESTCAQAWANGEWSPDPAPDPAVAEFDVDIKASGTWYLGLYTGFTVSSKRGNYHLEWDFTDDVRREKKHKAQYHATITTYVKGFTYNAGAGSVSPAVSAGNPAEIASFSTSATGVIPSSSFGGSAGQPACAPQGATQQEKVDLWQGVRYTGTSTVMRLTWVGEGYVPCSGSDSGCSDCTDPGQQPPDQMGDNGSGPGFRTGMGERSSGEGGDSDSSGGALSELGETYADLEYALDRPGPHTLSPTMLTVSESGVAYESLSENNEAKIYYDDTTKAWQVKWGQYIFDVDPADVSDLGFTVKTYRYESGLTRTSGFYDVSALTPIASISVSSPDLGDGTPDTDQIDVTHVANGVTTSFGYEWVSNDDLPADEDQPGGGYWRTITQDVQSNPELATDTLFYRDALETYEVRFDSKYDGSGNLLERKAWKYSLPDYELTEQWTVSDLGSLTGSWQWQDDVRVDHIRYLDELNGNPADVTIRDDGSWEIVYFTTKDGNTVMRRVTPLDGNTWDANHTEASNLVQDTVSWHEDDFLDLETFTLARRSHTILETYAPGLNGQELVDRVYRYGYARAGYREDPSDPQQLWTRGGRFDTISIEGGGTRQSIREDIYFDTDADPSVTATGRDGVAAESSSGTYSDSDDPSEHQWHANEPDGRTYVSKHIGRDGQTVRLQYRSDELDVVISGYCIDPFPNDAKVVYGERTRSYKNSEGQVIAEITDRVDRRGLTGSYSDSDWVPVESVVYDRSQDSFGRVTQTKVFHGAAAVTAWSSMASSSPTWPASGQSYTTTKSYVACCGLSAENHRTGAATVYHDLDQDNDAEISVEGYYTGTPQSPVFNAVRAHEIERDELGRTTAQRSGVDELNLTKIERTIGYDLASRVVWEEDAEGNKTYFRYQNVDSTGQTVTSTTPTTPVYQETRIYPHDQESGPVQVTWTDHEGRVVQSFSASASWTVGQAPSGTEALSFLSGTHYSYDWRGREVLTRRFHSDPGTLDLGATGLDSYYYETESVYDDQGRLFLAERRTYENSAWVVADVTTYAYDGDTARIAKIWVGTDAGGALAQMDPAGGGTGNLRLVQVNTFTDAGLTLSQDTAGPTSAAPVQGTAAHFITTGYETSIHDPDGGNADNAGVETWVKPELAPWQRTFESFDGTVTLEETYANGGATYPLSRVVRAYNAETGLAISEKVYGGDGATPLGDHMATYYHHDPMGRITETVYPAAIVDAQQGTWAGGMAEKLVYDTEGLIGKRLMVAHRGSVADTPDAADDGTGSDPLADDIVVEETEYDYDANSRVISERRLVRTHDSTALGQLSGNTAVTDYELSLMQTWYDPAGRVSDVADHGRVLATTQPVADPAQLPVGVRLVSYTYSDLGLLESMQAADGMISFHEYDALGRKLKTIENYIAPGTSLSDTTNRTTTYTYNVFDDIKTITAIVPGANDQETTYVYGYELGSGGGPVVYGQLLRETIYPDSTGVSDKVSMSYYADGSVHTRTDQRGVVTTYAYDQASRLIREENDLDSGYTNPFTDGPATTRSVEYAYTDRGLLASVTTAADTVAHSSTTHPRSEVRNIYDPFGRLTRQYQQHEGHLPTTLVGDELFVEVDYQAADSTGRMVDRKASITYPNGRQIDLGYDGHSVQGQEIGQRMNRVQKIVEHDGGAEIAAYQYRGLDEVILKRYDQPELELSYADQSEPSVARYGRLGRFGLPRQMLWQDTGPTTPVEVFNLTYTRDDELRPESVTRGVYTGRSTTYRTDNLGRLDRYETGSKVDADARWLDAAQEWDLDVLGNQRGVTDHRSDTWSGGAEDWAENTQFSDANEIVTREVNANRSPEPVGYDAFDNSQESLSLWSLAPNASGSLQVSGSALQVNGASDGIALLGGLIGPNTGIVTLKYAPSTTTGRAGYVFGFVDEDNYWLHVAELVDDGGTTIGQEKIIKVVNGIETELTNLTWTNPDIVTAAASGGTYTLVSGGRRYAVRCGPMKNLAEGYPPGLVGLYSSTSAVTFQDFTVYDNALSRDLGPRWVSYALGGENRLHGAFANGVLNLVPDAAATTHPTFIKGLWVERFDLMFKATRETGSSSGTFAVVFDADQPDEGQYLVLGHRTGGRMPSLTEFDNGDAGTAVFATSSDPLKLRATPNAGDELWVRIVWDGSLLSVYQSQWESQLQDPTEEPNTLCYTVDISDFDMRGGMIGFVEAAEAGDGAVYIDEVTLKTDRDRDTMNSFETTELEETFDTNGVDGEVLISVTYDAAGNLTYDGRLRYVYDADNRLVEVRRDNNAVGATNPVVARYEYDGLGRRIITHSYSMFTDDGDADNVIGTTGQSYQLTHETHYYYDTDSIIETRDDGDGIAKQAGVYQQFVWANLATGYIDELIQIALNQDPQNAYTTVVANRENTCERVIWAMHDASYNVLGVALPTGASGDARGSVLIERYEYTPYGERRVYSRQLLQTDINNDFSVDLVELSELAGPSDSSPESRLDYNGNGVVGASNDLADYSLFATEYGIPAQKATVAWVAMPVEGSHKVRTDASRHTTYRLCPIGHQGLYRDNVIGLIYNRSRYRHNSLNIFLQRDSFQYIDGSNLYQMTASLPIAYLDYTGNEIALLNEKCYYTGSYRIAQRTDTIGSSTLGTQRQVTHGGCECEYRCDDYDVRCVIRESPIDLLPQSPKIPYITTVLVRDPSDDIVKWVGTKTKFKHPATYDDYLTECLIDMGEWIAEANADPPIDPRFETLPSPPPGAVAPFVPPPSALPPLQWWKAMNSHLQEYEAYCKNECSARERASRP